MRWNLKNFIIFYCSILSDVLMRRTDINFPKPPHYVQDWRKAEAYPSCHQETVHTLNKTLVHHRTNTKTQLDKRRCAHSPIVHLVVGETHTRTRDILFLFTSFTNGWLKKLPTKLNVLTLCFDHTIYLIYVCTDKKEAEDKLKIFTSPVQWKKTHDWWGTIVQAKYR